VWLSALIGATAAGLLGCSNAALRAAQHDIAAHQYTAAHAELAQISGEHLSRSQRRQVQDGLCLTEFKIGAPTYPLPHQHQACAAAAALPGSTSTSILAQIDAAERSADAAAVNRALHAHDVAGAEAAMIAYRADPGADPQMLKSWSHQIWRQVNARTHRQHRASPAILAMARRYPRLRAMDQSAFRHWVVENATIKGQPMVSAVKIGHGALDLWVPRNQAETAALNLNRFARINDGLVARCGCDGHTNVAIESSGIPAYLLRLDPETRRSEVLILPRPR
jgi:hypothetical protein